MHGRGSNMEGVLDGPGGDQLSLQKISSKRCHVVGLLKYCDSAQFCETTGCGRGIPAAGLLQDQSRHEQAKPAAVLVPPFHRQLLMCRNDQIAAGTRGQVTDNGCLQVNRWFHHTIKPASPALAPCTTGKSLP